MMGDALFSFGVALMAQASSIAAPPSFRDTGRFCGYAPIIDLRPGEEIRVGVSGIHSGNFDWSGAFGSLQVRGIQWASRPRGTQIRRRTARGHIRFAERRDDGRFVIAIWNGRHGAAYFSSASPLTAAQRQAINRVDLFQEGEEPLGCDYRTATIWE